MSEITITPKQAWLFGTNKYKGKHGDAPKSKDMKPNQAKGSVFAYSVTAGCPRSDGTTSLVIIDPDIIIIQ